MNNDVETVRIEGNTVDVYWNDLNWLNNVRESGLSDCVWKINLCDPTTKADEEFVDFLPLDKYRYRVILKEMRNIDTNQVNALLELDKTGEVNITDKRKINWTRYNMFYKDWFYVEDDLTLTNVHLILGSKVHRVVEYKERNKWNGQ